MTKTDSLAEKVRERFADIIETCDVALDECTVEVHCDNLRRICAALYNEDDFNFEELIDVVGVDYLQYGVAQWDTENATASGFERGVETREQSPYVPWDKPRFAVVYHLLSVKHNQRIRVRTFVNEEAPMVDTVTDIWDAANWLEREVFDLYGILFSGHPDLRRILTDYGFIGHPFRKDFPLSGQVEMRYDATLKRVIYEPVDIEPRVLVPKVIRHDNRYLPPQGIPKPIDEEQHNA